MSTLDLPYQPIRRTLYTADELFSGFSADRPSSWGATADFAIFRHFVVEGRGAPRNPYSGMMQAMHDTTITNATLALVEQKRVVAIMGGHKLPRGARAYNAVAELSRRLTQREYVVCSGGGPGAMEASHLGAALARRSEGDLAAAIEALSKNPIVPNLATIVDKDGNVSAPLVEAAHAWFAPAYALSAVIVDRVESLSVPTWHYGHEPSTPFASHISKYFQNSIREDGLLALASHGVVFAEGKAGTIQEIFQDGAQNYYRSFGHFSPMVLLGADYWTTVYPVVPVLASLFGPEDFRRHVLVTDDVTEAAEFIEQFSP